MDHLPAVPVASTHAPAVDEEEDLDLVGEKTEEERAFQQSVSLKRRPMERRLWWENHPFLWMSSLGMTRQT